MSSLPDLLSDQPAIAADDDVLADVLRWLRIGGALFLRAEFSTPWAYESPPSEALAQALHPGARRVLLFHLVPEGDCVLWLRGGSPVPLCAGDVIILPYADQHWVGSSIDAPPVPIASLLPAQPWATMPVIRHGGGGEPTQIVCGYLHSDELAFNPVLSTLPKLMHLRPRGTPLAAWVDASFRYALHASQGRRSTDDVLLQRLPELLFAECLRLYRSQEDVQRPGWFGALADPVLGRALSLMHADPARDWTLDALAREASSSRSRLDAHFRQRLGMAPMTYLAQWRLQIAAHLLRGTRQSLAAIAERVGYASEASLSRAFKRTTGVSPIVWRRHGADTDPEKPAVL